MAARKIKRKHWCGRKITGDVLMSFRHSKIDKKAIMKVMDKKIAEKQALTKQRREEQQRKMRG